MNYSGSRKRIKEKVSEKIFEEIIVKNFPNVGKEIVNQIQETQRNLYRINWRKNMLRHILIKLEKILKVARENQQITYKRIPVMLGAVFFFNLFFYWRVIALQNFVIFCQTSTWISHRYTFVPSLLNLPPFSLPIPPL